MEKIVYEQLGETLFYEKMANGLEVYVLPKEGFNKTYATFTTKYGSIDNHFVPRGQTEMKRVPDGIAHFLEHKLFEKEDGDVFQLFSKQGASANAFTSFTRTAYLFSSTSNVLQNVETLLNFVQEPYFTEQTVEKEKGIISQEIHMYEDNPDWRIYFGTIGGMYDTHPVKIDIAGTDETIAAITKDLLYECYETFYHPSNMIFFVVGSLNAEEMMNFIRENQSKKTFSEVKTVERFHYDEKKERAKEKTVFHMAVQTPKCIVGVKSPVMTNLKEELAIGISLDYLFGKSSKHYEELYEKGFIDETFSYDYMGEREFSFALIGGDTKFPDALAAEIKMILQQFGSIEEEELERVKKKKIGTMLRALNSPEYIANQFTRYTFNQMSLFDIVSTVEKIQVPDIVQITKQLFQEQQMTICQVLPQP